MPKIWYNRIVAGTKTLSECPERYREGVLALLRADVESGAMMPERYEELTGVPHDLQHNHRWKRRSRNCRGW